MELSWLEDFLALAEHKTFSRAAEVRHVTQPAFSRRIRSLESWIGTHLFVRSPQGTALTPAGKFLRTHAEELTRNLHQVRQEALEVASKEASIISFAATHALSFVFFPAGLEVIPTLRRWVHSTLFRTQWKPASKSCSEAKRNFCFVTITEKLLLASSLRSSPAL